MINKVRKVFSSLVPYDEKTVFRDLRYIDPKSRRANSTVLNFYSSVRNIGNYTPVLGIQTLTEEIYDTWCAHDRNIDWKFINENYKKIIIGGAGLFHKGFENFWIEFSAQCKIPTIIWGVGGIFPKDINLRSNVSADILIKALSKCDLINLRDDLTANYIGLANINISPCPTIAYVDKLKHLRKEDRTQILYSSHEELLSKNEKEKIQNLLSELKYKYTGNKQSKFNGINRIIKEYGRSKVVITTRLHGAIIAYGLGIPYIAISFDKKIDEFHRLYGNGYLLSDWKDKSAFNEYIKKDFQTQTPEISAVKEFGDMAKKWITN